MWVLLYFVAAAVAEMEMPAALLKSQQPELASAYLNSILEGTSTKNSEVPILSSTSIHKSTENCPNSEILTHILNVLKSLLNERNKPTEPEKTVHVLGELKHYLEDFNLSSENNDVLNKLKLFETLNNENLETSDRRKISRQLDAVAKHENLRAKIIFQYEMPTSTNIHCKDTITTLIKMINIAYTQYLSFCKESGKCSEALKFPDVQYHPNVEHNMQKSFILPNTDSATPVQTNHVITDIKQPFDKQIRSKINDADILNIITGLEPYNSPEQQDNLKIPDSANLQPSILNQFKDSDNNLELKKVTDLINNNDLNQIKKPVYLPQTFVKNPNDKVTFTITSEGKIVPVTKKIENPFAYNVNQNPFINLDTINIVPKDTQVNIPNSLDELIKLYIQNVKPTPIASHTVNTGSNTQILTPEMYFKNIQPNFNERLFYETPKQINVSEPSVSGLFQIPRNIKYSTNNLVSPNQDAVVHPHDAFQNPYLNNNVGYQMYQILHPHASDNKYVSKYQNNHSPEFTSTNNFNPSNIEDKLIDLRWLGVTNADKLTTDKNGIVELTYVLNTPKPVHYEPYYVKFRLPYNIFLIYIQELLNKKPFLRENPSQLYQELLSNSNFTSTFADSKKINSNDIAKLATSGAIFTARIVVQNDTAANNELKLIQELNAKLKPEEILKLSGLSAQGIVQESQSNPTFNLNDASALPDIKLNIESVKPVYTNVQPIGYYSLSNQVYNQVPSSYVYSYNTKPLSQLNRLPITYKYLRPNLLSTVNQQINSRLLPTYQYSYLGK